MTEDEAKHLVEQRFGTAMFERVECFLGMVIAENTQQNLIATSTIPSIWSRHAMDSLQLLSHAKHDGTWLDIGSGGGFPGLIVGIARDDRTVLVEPRQRRADFLRRAVEQLGIGGAVQVVQDRVERLDIAADIMSARAVAGIEKLFTIAHHLAKPTTRWLLPRGSLVSEEIEQLNRRWSFMFHVERSEVSDASAIAIFEGVRRR